MKRLISVCAVVGFILTTTSLTTADDVIIPPWADQPGTVVAEWDSWTGFPDLMSPDEWYSNPPYQLYPPYAIVDESAELLESYEGRGNVIKLNGDDELKFHMTNFGDGGEDSYKDIWIQVTYHPIDPNQYFWFAVTADIAGISDEFFVDQVDRGGGWYTVAVRCQIWPNPSYEEISLNFFDFSVDEPLYPAYVDQVVINTRCIPEPATICLLGLGALSLIKRKK